MNGKTFRPDLWATAEHDTLWSRSEVQTFLYDRPEGAGWKAGNMVVRDRLKPSWDSQVIWQKQCTEETYEDVSSEAERFVSEYRAQIIYDRYIQLIGE